MYVLSFRDMSLARCGAVTSAAIYETPAMGSGFAWTPPNTKAMRLVGWDEVALKFRRKHVCFLIHGFNVDRDNGYLSLGPLAQEMMGQGTLRTQAAPAGPLDLHTPGIDLVVPVLWPGDWYSPVNYPFVLPDARTTGQNFAEFIWSSATGMARVSFLTHSFGARVVLETVQRAWSAKGRYPLPIFDTAIITAGAASDTVLDSPAYADAVTSALQRIVVVSAATDSVLAGDFPIGNAVEQALWSNDAGTNVALGHAGPRLTASSAARSNTTWFDLGVLAPAVDQQHGDYLPAPTVPTPGFPNGWSDKRERIGALAQAVFQNRTPPWPSSVPIPES